MGVGRGVYRELVWEYVMFEVFVRFLYGDIKKVVGF